MEWPSWKAHRNWSLLLFVAGCRRVYLKGVQGAAS
jgi:hypothetical protein